jgi:ABC-2 type transport system ATP-binding protein
MNEVNNDSFATTEEIAIQTENLTKHYKSLKFSFNPKKICQKFTALDDVNLSLKRGRIIGLLGKNGAGKSTLMRCLLGLLKFEGDIAINNKAVTHLDHEIYERVAFIPDVNEIDDRLTVEQTINYIRGVHPKWNEERAERLLKISNLNLKQKVKTLSKGMKTKLYLLVTLALDVDILLLDEPTIGLDIAFKREFFNTILGEYFDENKLIVISSHQIEEIEMLLSEVIFLHEGKLIMHDEVEKLKSSYHLVSLPSDRQQELEALNPVYKTKSLGIVTGLFSADVTIEGATYNRPQISDIFLSITGGYDGTV